MSADSSDNDEYPARGWKTLQLDTRDALLFLAKNHQHQRFDALPPRAPGHVCFITCRAAVAIWQKMKLSSEKWSSIVHLNMKSPLITKQTAQHTSHCWHKWVGRKMGWLNSYCKRLLENGSPLGSPHFLASGQITSCLPLKDYWCPSFFFDSEESGTFRKTIGINRCYRVIYCWILIIVGFPLCWKVLAKAVVPFLLIATPHRLAPAVGSTVGLGQLARRCCQI